MTRHTTYDAPPDAVSVRETADDVDGRDGLFTITMPVSSTGESRNDGDEAFSEERLRAMTDQFEDGIAAFVDHGRTGPGDTRYSALRQIGIWREPRLDQADNGDRLLVADATILDPAELDVDGDIGEIRNALNLLKAHVSAGIPLTASIGWRETGTDPTDIDVIEASIVGIGADENATQSASLPEQARSALADLPAGSATPSRSSDPMGWYETTERETAKRALDTIEEYHERELSATDRGFPETSSAEARIAPTVKELLRQFGHGSHSVTITERLETLRGDGREVLARLDQIEEFRVKTVGPDSRPYDDSVRTAIRRLRRLVEDEDDEETDEADLNSTRAWRA